MGQRLDLQTLLETIVEHVYFSPPNGMFMTYPCIVYHRRDTSTDFADNTPYQSTKRYEVTVIDEDPDSLIPDQIASLPMCTHNRFFPAGNLFHDVYELYF